MKVSELPSSDDVTDQPESALRPMTMRGMAGTVTPRASRWGSCTSTSQKKPGTAQPVCGPL